MTVIIDGTTGITNNSGTLISASTVGVGGATPAASGAGVTFPATQSASTDANTLDDYEEGTWTPTLGTLTQVGGTLSSSGRYTKIGRSVTVTGRLDISGGTVAGAAGSYLSSLPFTVGGISCIGSATNNNLTASFTSDAEASTTDLYFTVFSAASGIKFSVTYFV